MSFRKYNLHLVWICQLLLIFTSNPTRGISQQTVYHTSWQKDGQLIGAGIGLLAIDLGLHTAGKTLSVDDIAALDHRNVFGFDSYATGNYAPWAQRASDICRSTSALLPLTLLAFKPIRQDGWKLGLLYLETNLIGNALSAFAKTTVQRVRPFIYNPDVDISLKTTKSARRSFYSGHASQTASLAFLTAKVLIDYYPDSSWEPLAWTGAILLPFTAGYFRVKAGRHFPTDVMVGSIVGAAVGYFIPEMHRKDKKSRMSLEYSGSNSGVSLVISLN